MIRSDSIQSACIEGMVEAGPRTGSMQSFKKTEKVALVTFSILLVLVTVPWALMIPRDPHYSFAFLHGAKPKLMRLVQEMSGPNCYEVAIYSWDEPFDQVVANTKREFPVWKSWSVERKDYRYFGLTDPTDQSGIEIWPSMSSQVQGDPLWNDSSGNGKSCLVFISHRLPPGPFTDLRIKMLGSHQP